MSFVKVHACKYICLPELISSKFFCGSSPPIPVPTMSEFIYKLLLPESWEPLRMGSRHFCHGALELCTYQYGAGGRGAAAIVLMIRLLCYQPYQSLLPPMHHYLLLLCLPASSSTLSVLKRSQKLVSIVLVCMWCCLVICIHVLFWKYKSILKNKL